MEPGLREYFSLNITDDNSLGSLSCIVPKYKPNKTWLSLYLLRLATEVNWQSERECFETFCRETARYYAKMPDAEYNTNIKAFKWQIEHVLYPAIKKYLLPPERLRKEFYELTSLPNLYKVFERC